MVRSSASPPSSRLAMGNSETKGSTIAIPNIRQHLRAGQVIPAHPLALDRSRKLDEKRQRALTRYEIAAALGYDAALLSLGAWRDAPESEILDHCRVIAEIMPVFGFYLQPAVGG